MITELPTLDALLEQHAEIIGPSMTAYRNHCYRMVNFTVALAGDDEQTLEKIQIAAAFHDIGVWTHQTMDYLAPSEKQARDYLASIGKSDWADEIGDMVEWHHKITPLKQAASPLVEAFRKADWADVLHGVVGYGIPRATFRNAFKTWADAGFHWLLVKLSVKRLLTHPWSPLPIFRW